MKKLLSLILVLSLILCLGIVLASCDNDDKTDDSTPSSTTESTPASTSDSTADSTTNDSNDPASKPAGDSEPADSKPADSEPADSKPADSKPADSEPADSEPEDSKPEDPNPGTDDEASIPQGTTVSEDEWNSFLAETGFSFTLHNQDGSYVNYEVNGSDLMAYMYEDGEGELMYQTVANDVTYIVMDIMGDGTYYGIDGSTVGMVIPFSTINDVFAESGITYGGMTYNEELGCYTVTVDAELYYLSFVNDDNKVYVLNTVTGEQMIFENIGSTVVEIPEYQIYG